MAAEQLTPPLMRDGTLLPARLNEEKSAKKRKLPISLAPEIVDETHGNVGPVSEPMKDHSVKYSVVWNKLTKHRDGNVSGRVFKLDQSMSSDICVQIVKKYNKFAIHIGAFRISVSGGAPESYNSDSYVAKKGLAVLSMENIEALAQLKNVLAEEMEQLKNM